MTDMVIPPEAREAVARLLNPDVFNPFVASHRSPSAPAKRADARDKANEILEAALPHLRPMLELAGNLGRELGRREMAEEIALALEAEALSDYDAADDLRWAAMKAREIATKEPTDEPEASRTRCSHCGFYRPSLLNHHPECPHAATKEPK